MSDYDEELKYENLYIEDTLSLIKKNLQQELTKVAKERKELIDKNKYMWENTVHFIDDVDRLSDINQNLSIIQIQASTYEKIEEKIFKYNKMLNKPYFARVDFTEQGGTEEKIYIGLFNLMDEDNYEPYVYDWRSPIASIFYRYELGFVVYEAPESEITGEVSLKRQYEIKDGKLKYFFDSGLNIIDDVLKSVLSKNTSSKMKTIVETIQREQDIAIRDIESELLIVQGVAGSGKTSIALHRVAFLMYQGLLTKLYANNIVIISPNELFGKYISEVLPELGEENISNITFENIFSELFNREICIKSKNETLEEIITCENKVEQKRIKSTMEFKCSKEFVTILNRLIDYFEHRLIEFRDVYYNGRYIAQRHLLKAFLLKDSINIPIAKRLKIIEARILDEINPIRKKRLEKLQIFVSRYPEHQFEIKSLARLISIKESTKLLKEIRKFTEIDYMCLYKKLLKDKKLFYRLAAGLKLPSNIEEILDDFNNISGEVLRYEDALGLLYLKAKLTGYGGYKDIKQVVVDEAQDYYPIHFEILKVLFRNSRYTILGDINQTIEKDADSSLYDDIKSILDKKRTATVTMTKSFRCSYEISSFSNNFLEGGSEIECFERHEEPPVIISKEGIEELDDSIIGIINDYKSSGYESIAIICKSRLQSNELYEKLRNRIEIISIDDNTKDTMSGVMIIPICMAKGLEFDAVIVYGTDNLNYKTKYDKKLLYIACTRALHKLALFYIGDRSSFLLDS